MMRHDVAVATETTRGRSSTRRSSLSLKDLKPVRRASRGRGDENETESDQMDRLLKAVQTDTSLLLKDGEHIFKPLQVHDGNGQAERKFYEDVQGFRLADFCPKFHGCQTLDGVDHEYLQLEDLTAGFEKPAIMDLKMGTKKFYAVAAQKGLGDRYPAAKVERQAAADRKRTSGSLGFLVSGLHAPPCGDLPDMARNEAFGKTATDADALGAVQEFIERAAVVDENGVRTIAAAFANQLRPILEWYETEQTHALYNCSLLFAYDAANPQIEGRAQVRIIDYCHTWELEPDEVDVSGVDHGLRSLLNLLDPLSV